MGLGVWRACYQEVNKTTELGGEYTGGFLFSVYLCAYLEMSIIRLFFLRPMTALSVTLECENPGSLQCTLFSVFKKSNCPDWCSSVGGALS